MLAHRLARAVASGAELLRSDGPSRVPTGRRRNGADLSHGSRAARGGSLPRHVRDGLRRAAAGLSGRLHARRRGARLRHAGSWLRSEEHTSELQSLMRTSYAVFCLKKNLNTYENITTHPHIHT